MNYYALIYDVVDDYLVKRSLYRNEHLALANEAVKRGELLLGGAFDDPADQALLIFRSHDSSVAENFVRHDPYVLHGLVKQWKIRQWNVVAGNR